MTTSLKQGVSDETMDDLFDQRTLNKSNDELPRVCWPFFLMLVTTTVSTMMMMTTMMRMMMINDENDKKKTTT